MSVRVQKSKRTSYVCKKIYLESTTCTYENGKYLERIIGDSGITCDEIIELTKAISMKATSSKTVLTNLTEKR